MNKINCKIQSNIFEDLPIGTIFLDKGCFYIKISQEEIWDGLGLAEDCNFEDEIDRSTVPNAVCLNSGSVAYFDDRSRIDMIYLDATLSIN